VDQIAKGNLGRDCNQRNSERAEGTYQCVRRRQNVRSTGEVTRRAVETDMMAAKRLRRRKKLWWTSFACFVFFAANGAFGGESIESATYNPCSKWSHTVKDRVFQVCDVVRETGFAMHKYFGSGHLEKVYENSYTNRLRKLGLDVKQQHPIKVRDEDGTIVGEYVADLLIENILIVELKAARCTNDEHIAQLLGYLRATEIEHGLLVNFGAPKFYIKKYAMSSNRM
jgi:GxxExxY protein